MSTQSTDPQHAILATDDYSLNFGEFSLALPQRLLSRAGTPLRLGSRAMGILVTLATAPGTLLSRETLIATVWPDAVVDEGALRVHLYALRKALGDGADGQQFIVNESGRGYRFVSPVQRLDGASPVVTGGLLSTLPAQLTRVLGRDAIIAQLCDRLCGQRCLTISGPGGIGKTTVALAIAHDYVNAGHGNACFVDFGPVDDPALVTHALAAALGVADGADDEMVATIVASLAPQALLLLDNCEHLVETLTPVVERLLRDVPGLQLLVTSREPLRMAGEWVYRLAPLDTPEVGSVTTVKQAQQFAAVHLFVERASEVRESFVLSEKNVAAVCEICSELDGVPLAIEFAAARADWLDVENIASTLGERFEHLTNGRRTALPRQQTLRAGLDWSYDLLSSNAQLLLQRISLFSAPFDMPAIIAVAVESWLNAAAVRDGVGELVAKSLLTCNVNNEGVQFQLLRTVHHYGIERLQEQGGGQRAARRHAEYYRALFAGGRDASGENRPRQDMRRQRNLLADVRAAVEWAFSAEGDPACGTELLISASGLWLDLCTTNDFLALAARALALGVRDTAPAARLLGACGQAHWHTNGPGNAMASSFEEALAVAQRLTNRPLERTTLFGLWMHRIANGRYVDGMQLAERYQAITLPSDSVGSQATAAMMLAQSRFYKGDTRGARALLEHIVDTDAPASHLAHIKAAQVNGRLLAQAQLAICMCLQGETTAAVALARNVASAEAHLNDQCLCMALANGIIPVAIMAGELTWAAALCDTIRARAKRTGAQYWDRWGIGYQAVLNGSTPIFGHYTVLQLETFTLLGHARTREHLRARGRHLEPGWIQPALRRPQDIRCVEHRL